MLARKAAALPAGVSLAGWLFRATQFAAADAMKMARRRRRHEKEAATLAAAARQVDDSWRRLEPHLEEALARLSDAERDAVLLRYFRDMSAKEAGAAQGISEGAAAQRLSRGLKKLRAFFARKGIEVPAASLGPMISANAVEATPGALATSIVQALAAPAAATAAAAAAAERVLHSMAATAAKAKVVAAFVIAAVAAGGAAVALTPQWLRRAAPTPPVAAADVVAADALRAAWGPEWAAHRIARGWPVGLPGAVTGTPAPADLDGDGDLEILVPCMHSPMHRADNPPLHPRPRIERLLFAFHHDGTPVAGWPAVIMDEAKRRVAIEGGGFSEDWSSSPSVMDWDGDKRDEVVILDRAGTVVVEHENSGPVVVRVAGNGDGIGTAPLADLNGDGVPDLVMGHVLTNVNGESVRGWPASRRLVGGFAPAIGDANGDGKLELFHPFYLNPGTVCSYDATGVPLAGWPQKVSGQCRFGPVLGDVDGDGMLEVVAVHGTYVSVWRWDGRPLEGTRTVGELAGVFKENVAASEAAPTVADLDGDGAGEVIVFDRADRTIKAWHGDGRGFRGGDRAVARLAEAECWGGVTVANLGGDGTMDLFAATSWVELARDGDVKVTAMVPAGGATTSHITSQCTIADVDRDGDADVVFGLTDGRVFVFDTGKAYRAEWMLWPTSGGNSRRTGTAPPAVRGRAARAGR